MANQKTPNCECGNQMRRIYARDPNGFTALDLYYCESCGEVYEFKIEKKQMKKLSHEEGQKFLKRAKTLKDKETHGDQKHG